MQYCSLQHRTLLLSPVTSTAGYCFCFGFIPSFFLELYLHWSPVAYWTPTARRSNQSLLKEINPGISLERMMLKLKLQYFGHLMQRVDSGKDPDAGRDWGQEKGTTEDEMAGWMWVWVNSRRWWWTGRPGMLQFMGLLWVGHDWATGLIWTELCFVLLSCSKATQLSIGKSKELPSQWINNQVLHHHSLQRKFLLKLKAKLKQRAKTIKLLWVHLKHKCLPSTWEENVFTC